MQLKVTVSCNSVDKFMIKIDKDNLHPRFNEWDKSGQDEWLSQIIYDHYIENYLDLTIDFERIDTIDA